MIKKPFDKFLMFDVESVGLHGGSFAFGWVIMVNGQEVARGEYGCNSDEVRGDDDDRKWVAANVTAPINCNQFEIIGKACEVLAEAQSYGLIIVSDCAWPVETNFLSLCQSVTKDFKGAFKGPYPLYDLSSVLAALGYDPIGTYPRKENELPAHNPLNDARQSARVLIEALAGTLERPE